MKCKNSGCGANFSMLQWKYRCGRCHQHFCSTHIRPWKNLNGCHGETHRHEFGRYSAGEGLCYPCTDECKADVEREERARKEYERLAAIAAKMEAFSAAFKGRIPVDPSGPCVQLSTRRRRERSDAELELKIEAVKHGCDVVYEVKFETTKDSEPSDNGVGTYRYTRFRYTGKGGKRHG